MNVVIIGAVYPPEPFVSARMGYDLAMYFADHGHGVTVICPQPSRPVSADYRKYHEPRKPFIEWENRVKVVRLPSFAAPYSRALDRAHESLSFGRHVWAFLSHQKERPAVMYVNAWPLLSQALIVGYAYKKVIPLALQVMDIYPESLLIKCPGSVKWLLASPLTWLDRWIAQRSNALIVISENMRKIYTRQRGIPEEKVVTVKVWQDERLFEKSVDRKKSCARYGVPDGRFTFLYLGNIGPVAGVDFLIRAFHESRLENSQLLIVGDGSVKQSCMKLASRLQARNIIFISDHAVENVPLLQSMAHVCLLPLKNGSGMSSIPSKLPAYLFSAKPVIATVDKESDTANVIRQAGCGWVGEPEDIKWLTAKMRETAVMSISELEKLGQSGKKFGFVHFSRKEGVKRLGHVCLRLANVNNEGKT